MIRWFVAHMTMLLLILVFAAAAGIIFVEYGLGALGLAAIMMLAEFGYFVTSFTELMSFEDGGKQQNENY